MFCDYVFEKSSARYANKILLFDDENLNCRVNFISAFSAHGFEIVEYTDDLSFRIEYEEKLKDSSVKLAIIANSKQYIPFDVQCLVSKYVVALGNLFPKLNQDVIATLDRIGLDLLSAVYDTNFDDLSQKQDTEVFLKLKVYSRTNVKTYLNKNIILLIEKAKRSTQYYEWFAIAEEKAMLDKIAIQYDVDVDTQEINRLFQKYALAEFGKLSQNIDKKTPIIISKTMDYLYENSDKFILIVMDGMSEFDWNIISASFTQLQYEKTSMFAMIPSTTSISRQCLLAGKYPVQLLEPWKQSKEKSEFFNCAKRLGYTEAQIGYERGYDAQFSSLVRCGTVIINDVDDIVHSQKQSRLGMFNDINVLANQKKLVNMVKRYIGSGYDVYITADHGNTLCTGLGKLMRTGVEVETKSRRMVVLKDFADKAYLIDKYRLVEYPKYYLPKEYDYLICDVGDSFDANGEDVMTHGGITLDEVVVPFVKIKAVCNYG